MSNFKMQDNRNLAFIPAAYGLGLVPHVYYLSRMMVASSFQWSNIAPRENWDLLRSKIPGNVFQRCLRARGAHLNAMEGFPVFAAAVLASQMTDVPSEEVRTMAWEYLGLRTLYTMAYMGIRSEAASYVRTGLWGCSLALPMWTLIKCATKSSE